MKKATRTVGPKGQVVIPKESRMKPDSKRERGQRGGEERGRGDPESRPLAGSCVDYFIATYARKVEKAG